MTSRRGFRSGRLQEIRLLLAALLIMVPASCRSGRTAAGGAGADEAPAAHLDVGCMLDRVEKPPEPFHYSYKYADASRRMDQEADVTPQLMDVKITDESGTHSYHGVRSDEHSWTRAVLDVSNLSFTSMMGRMAGYDGTSVIKSRGSEQVNGYSATRYEIDSGSANESDRNTFSTLFGPGSFDKGTVWIGPDGCAVKILLDEGLSQPSGQVDKRHYEISRLKG